MQQRRTQAERRSETRGQLLAAAATVIARRGYLAASVSEIAKEAGCSTGALYVHFAGKRELFLALFDAALTDWADGYLSAVTNVQSVDSVVTAVGARWGKLQDETPERTLLFIEFWSAAVREPELRAEFVQRHETIRATITALVRTVRAVTGVELALSDEEYGSIITALADGFALQRLADPAAVPDSLFVTAVNSVLGLR
ncbi:TetR/AcrR family transcriptional regulator [Nocardia sp. NPDC058058]|uniref:TetR/AcrR family transcriptional regulator n=1 Tax=Nocardia sp. NPDC058058 TaxID=3346317 RepID=UPI0036DD4F16